MLTPVENSEKTPAKSSSNEYKLVVALLIVLTLLVSFILFLPTAKPDFPIKNTDGTVGQEAFSNYQNNSRIYYQNGLDYKKNILAIILTAFGAWVGAGAAYFFGRENLRESANSLLQLHKQMTGGDKLDLIKVRDIPPKPLNSNFDEGINIGDLVKKIEEDPKKWFISTNTGGKWYIISKDAIYRYTQNQSSELSQKDITKTFIAINDEISKKTLKDAVVNIAADKDMAHFINQFVSAELDDSAALINNQMDVKGVFLGIIKDNKGNFIQYFTTNDIRKSLLKI